MDTRKIRKLIELVKETGIGELEVKSGEESAGSPDEAAPGTLGKEKGKSEPGGTAGDKRKGGESRDSAGRNRQAVQLRAAPARNSWG